MESLKKLHMRRPLRPLRTALVISTWPKHTAVSWRQGSKVLVCPCKSLPSLSNSRPTASILHYLRTTKEGSRWGVPQWCRRPRHKNTVATSSNKWAVARKQINMQQQKNCWWWWFPCGLTLGYIVTASDSQRARVVSCVSEWSKGSMTYQRVKHCHESHGTWNQESLCRPGPAAI
jgi:hypothetical protein